MLRRSNSIDFTLTFNLITPLIIKEESNEEFLDSVISRTPSDRLYINGYQWASLFKRALQRLDNTFNLPTVKEFYSSKGSEGVSPFWFKTSEVPIPFTDYRTGIKLHRRYLSAETGALYMEEVVPPGYELNCSFKVYLLPEEEARWKDFVDVIEEALWVIDHYIENLGGHWSYGYGRLKLKAGNAHFKGESVELKPRVPSSIKDKWKLINVKVAIAPGQLLAIHSEDLPVFNEYIYSWTSDLPDYFVFRSLYYEPEKKKFTSRIVIPGKAIRQALFSVPLERKWRTMGKDVCLLQEPRSSCRCKRCIYFGSSERRGLLAVMDAAVDDAETLLLRRVQLCEHSYQNINLFLEEFMVSGKFSFYIIIDRIDEAEELRNLIREQLEELSWKSSPPNWYRLGGNSTSTGQIKVEEWDEEL